MHSVGAGALESIHAAWATVVSGMFAGAYGDILTVDQQCTELQTDSLDPITGANTAQVRSAVTFKGSLAVEPTTPQRAAIVTGLRTALPTRAGRGRLFWPGPAGSILTSSGQLPAADASSISALLASLLGTMSATTSPVIYHRATRTTTPVTSVTVGVVLGTQRRRTNKVASAFASTNI